MTPSHGSARYDPETGILTVTTMRKRGKRSVPLVVSYRVEDARPDPKVAFPVFSLTKESGEMYHVSQDQWGLHCDCRSGEIREKYGSTNCKHAAACAACGLFSTKFTGAS